jgi:transposase
MNDTTIAVDLAKNVFEIAVSHEAGKVSEQKRVSRPKLVSFFAKRPAATVLLEACGSSHYWARRLRSFGHTVVLLPPHLVKPYRRGSKTDRADTKALLEAYRNEEIRPVPIKSVPQHVLTALHRLRSGWLSARTARINAVRGIRRELGHFIPKGARFVVPAITELVEDPNSELPEALRSHLEEACCEIRELKKKCTDIEHELQALSNQLPEVQRLLTVPGIGLLTATAVVAFVGDLRRFPSGRCFASYLGVVPKENSSGDVRRLGRISKRGDSYIRMLLTHGGRSVLRAAHLYKSPPDKLRAWALKIHRSRGHNKAAIAVANKLARILWAVSTREANYQPVSVAA